jgi:hypothetical protein
VKAFRELLPRPPFCAVIAVALLAGALALSGLPVAAASPVRSLVPVHASVAPCPDVYFLGARGSGENDDSRFYGMGQEVDAMATVVSKVLAAGHFSFERLADVYPADKVNDLKPTTAELAGALAGLLLKDPELTAAAARYYYEHNVKAYLASLNTGIANAVSEAEFVHRRCPHALLILAGYSQGAMAMHQAELRLAASGKTSVLGQIAGTLLLGDGDRVSRTAAREFGTSKDAAVGVRTYLITKDASDVLDPATTANICNAGDVVCNFGISTLLSTIFGGKGLCVHESYVVPRKGCPSSHNDALTKAATWVASLATARLASGDWTAAKAPLPAGAGDQASLSSVACPSATWCVAVGDYVDSDGDSPGLLLTRSGRSWRPQTAPLPPGAAPSPNLSSVACSSPSWCVAVGSYTDSAGQPHGLLLTWTGKKWTATRAPLPGPDPDGESVGGSLVAVACPSASSCVATGSYGEYYASDGETAGRGLLLNWTGTSWRPTEAPGTIEPVGAVACPSAAACTAIGYFGTVAAGEGVLLLTWSPGKWTAAEAPWPTGATVPGSVMDAYVLACPSPSSCLVPALYFAPGGTVGQGVMLSGAGTKWTDTKVKGGLLDSAACPSASSCVFGGTGQVLEGSGPPWKAVPMPALASDELMTPLACASASSCAIAGQFTDGFDSVIVTGSGSTWAASELPLPPDTAEPGFNSIACPTPAECVAVGSFDAGGTVDGLIATGPS